MNPNLHNSLIQWNEIVFWWQKIVFKFFKSVRCSNGKLMRKSYLFDCLAFN